MSNFKLHQKVQISHPKKGEDCHPRAGVIGWVIEFLPENKVLVKEFYPVLLETIVQESQIEDFEVRNAEFKKQHESLPDYVAPGFDYKDIMTRLYGEEEAMVRIA